ncbi:acyl-CoA dehydrogenase family protein [Cryptosporangium sp. NPDC051539]|uniref:acyl-CoA dehydrogenase family protein n=1 Tax=Cryptosporangium sp. NPDC051539 TaxID=3363962 RepID=UPI00379F1BF8
MDLTLDDERKAFVAESRRMLERVCPTEVVRAASTPHGTGHSDEVWRAVAGAGWLGIPFDPEWGGAGASVFDLGLAFREAGRALVPSTLSSTVAAGLYLDRLGTAVQKRRWLPSLCDGLLVAAVALAEPGVVENLGLTRTAARRVTSGWSISGTKAYVPNAERADVLLVLARVPANLTGSRLALLAVPRGSAGVHVDPYLTFGEDALHEVVLDGVVVPDDALLGPGDAGSGLEADDRGVDDCVRVLRTMEILGGIEAVLDRTVAYATERRQFGVAIGSFQAVQHHLSDIAMRLEAGRIAAYRALWTVSEGRSATREIVAAEDWLRGTYIEATLAAHQVWGGMGYALEGGLYLWSQRAKTLDLQIGRRADRLERLLTDAGS